MISDGNSILAVILLRLQQQVLEWKNVVYSSKHMFPLIVIARN